MTCQEEERVDGTEQPHAFDEDYWRRHWEATDRPVEEAPPANPHLVAQTASLAPGTAIDAGCGEGAEAIWLAEHGWRVTAVDISPEALARAAARAGDVQVEWVVGDLTTWEPSAQVDLVTTHYAHPAMPQLAFYSRIATWVAPGGTLLIVAHLHDPQGPEPVSAQVTLASVRTMVDAVGWQVDTVDEHVRTVPGREAPLRDVVVRARRT